MPGSSRCFLYCDMVTGWLVWSHRGPCLRRGLLILPGATKTNRGPTLPEQFPVMWWGLSTWMTIEERFVFTQDHSLILKVNTNEKQIPTIFKSLTSAFLFLLLPSEPCTKKRLGKPLEKLQLLNLGYILKCKGLTPGNHAHTESKQERDISCTAWKRSRKNVVTACGLAQ